MNSSISRPYLQHSTPNVLIPVAILSVISWIFMHSQLTSTTSTAIEHELYRAMHQQTTMHDAIGKVETFAGNTDVVLSSSSSSNKNKETKELSNESISIDLLAFENPGDRTQLPSKRSTFNYSDTSISAPRHHATATPVDTDTGREFTTKNITGTYNITYTSTAKHHTRPTFPYRPLAINETGDGKWLPNHPFLDLKIHTELMQTKECDTDLSEGHFTTHLKRWNNRVTVCEGPSTIECMLDAPEGIPVTPRKGKRAGLVDPIVRFCTVEGAWPPSEACSEPNRVHQCAWRAFCRPTGWWASQGGNLAAPLWRGIGDGNHNWWLQRMIEVVNPSQIPTTSNIKPYSQALDRHLHYLVAGGK